MNGFGSRLESILLAAARRCMPAHRRAWAEAMRAESAYLPSHARLRWAFGCLVGAIKARFVPMDTGNLRINRWVLLVEVLGCFGPATLAWWIFTFGPGGLIHVDGAMIEKVFFDVPGGTYFFFVGWVGFGLSGLAAVIGLILGLRYVARGHGLPNRVLGYTLMAVPALQSIAGAFSSHWSSQGEPAVRAGLFVLLTLLPIAGIAHLLYLSRPALPPVDAKLAAG